MVSRKKNVLVIDDDNSICWQLNSFLSEKGFSVQTSETGNEGLEMFRKYSPDVILLDLKLPDIGGLEVLSAMRKDDPNTQVIMISGHGQTKIIVTAMQLGAADFINKPLDMNEVEITINNVLEKGHLQGEVQRLKSELMEQEGFKFIIGDSKEMQEVKNLVGLVANSDVNILIRGESGTGKELVARALRMNSLRAQENYVKVNCAALPEHLLEAELFGYEKGAFTGAHTKKPGRFEFADKGTIFLDEIGEIPPSLQAKLLQVLQEGRFTRLGAVKDIQINVRVIAATNVDLEAAMSAGNFREDLYYRLNEVSIFVPSLRNHPEDIPMLINHFLEKYNQEYQREYPFLSQETMELFMQYTWPGNIRELENMIKGIIILGREDMAVQELTSGSRQNRAQKEASPQYTFADNDMVSLKELSKQASIAAEKQIIERVLMQTGWNRTKAAERLQISYKALLYKIKECGIGPDR